MLKIRDLSEVSALYDLIIDPKVYPFVRHKPQTNDEYFFMTKQIIEAEERGEVISRTILDEYQQPIGTINLFDIRNNHGFLATWIGSPYFGKGYNRLAKELFFDELFFKLNIEAIFMKIKKKNIRSLKAILKLPYTTLANEEYQGIYKEINQQEEIYDLFLISKNHYEAYKQFSHQDEQLNHTIDGEVVS